MNAFANILGKQILNVQRLDKAVDYEFYSPCAIIMIIDGQEERTHRRKYKGN